MRDIHSSEVAHIKELRKAEFIEINSDSEASQNDIEDQEIGIDNAILERLQENLD